MRLRSRPDLDPANIAAVRERVNRPVPKQVCGLRESKLSARALNVNLPRPIACLREGSRRRSMVFDRLNVALDPNLGGVTDLVPLQAHADAHDEITLCASLTPAAAFGSVRGTPAIVTSAVR
jgi:hypothetical protein